MGGSSLVRPDPHGQASNGPAQAMVVLRSRYDTTASLKAPCQEPGAVSLFPPSRAGVDEPIPQRREVDRALHPQGTPEGPTAFSGVHALRVHPGSTPRPIRPRIGLDRRTSRDHSQQGSARCPLPTAQAGAKGFMPHPRRVRLARWRGAHASASGAEPGPGPDADCDAGSVAASGPSTATSGRISMRHPVNRAASRAFWPSRPIASDS